MTHIVAILPAAGLGTRMGADTPKQFLELEGVPLVIHTLRRLSSCKSITEMIVATRGDGVAQLDARIRHEKLKQPVRVVRGCYTRHDSLAAPSRVTPAYTSNIQPH